MRLSVRIIQVLLLMGALGCAGARVAAAEPFVLRASMLRGLVEGQNERVRAGGKRTEAAEKRKGHLARSYLPSISLKAAQESFKKGNHTQETQPAYGAEASINLFNGGRDTLKADAFSFAVERRASERSVEIYSELVKAKEAYFGILFHRDLLDLVRETREANTKNLTAADRRIRSGVATNSDRFEFEMEEVELARTESHARFQIDLLSHELAALTGIALDRELAFPEKFTHEHDWESEIQHDERDHEFLTKPTELTAKELGLGATGIARAWWPRLDAYAGWHQENQLEEDSARASDRRESVIGIRLTMDIFQGFSVVNEGGALRAEAAAAELEAAYRKKQVELEIHRELLELRYLHSQIHAAEQNVERARRYYTLTQSEYSRGVKNSPDVLGATEKIFESRRTLLEMMREFQVSKSHVLAKIGK